MPGTPNRIYLRERVTINIQEIKKIVEKIQEQTKLALKYSPHIAETAENFQRDLSQYIEFMSDHKNNQVLQEYYEIREEKYPLDVICNELFMRIRNVDENLLLVSNVMGNSKEAQNIWNSLELGSLQDSLYQLMSSNLLKVFPVLRLLSGHNKTLIVMGPNGSGKTSFANYLRNESNFVKVIPANKSITVDGNMRNHFTSTIENFNKELYGDKQNYNNLSSKSELLQKLIVGICNEHDDIAREHYKGSHKEKKVSIFQKIKEVFDSFFEVKLDDSQFRNKEIMGIKNGDVYSFNNMSDGERVAFFYIATVIAAPLKSFIIVDEPENHLNPAVYNKIWDKLLELRGDCQFIFISHTMEFINARTNFELLKIKKYTPNLNYTGIPNFEFDFLGDSLDDIDPGIIVEVVGSRKPILFCEGSKTDYDYTIYESIFGEKYTILPTGNSKSVINSVIACNVHSTTYSIQEAIGIIDSDVKSVEEVDQLESKMIYTLPCNEIEMLLLDEDIFKKVLEHQFMEMSKFIEFKNLFFDKLRSEKERIIKRIVKTQIDECLNSTIIDDKVNKTKDEIKGNLDSIFKSIDVDNLWSSCSSKIDDILNSENYQEALKYCSLEHSEIIGGLTNKIVSGYAAIAVGVLKEPELRDKIKTKYFDRIG